ncbi:hypothetical protein [Runella slithyformis]|uniref:hypothetical protein n=1 Tax=Runella slithyformis TaxID=106 RepID=UPI00059D1161|nr:hypothetical protein [Runella slithyformis]
MKAISRKSNFQGKPKQSPVADRGGHIESSLFTAHLGTAIDFVPKFRAHLDGYKPLGADLIFISDGAIWLRQLMTTHYPQATLVLDFWHAMTGPPLDLCD